MVTGRKSAVLVACSYYNTPSQMYGCEKDVETIKELLEHKFFFNDVNSSIITLIERESPNSPNQPTKENIEKKLKNMIEKATNGDILFFYFSGMAKLEPPNDTPAICSSDHKHLTADCFRSLLKSLPEDASFTFVCESSYSGDFLDPTGTEKSILISACKANETAERKPSQDGDNSTMHGLFTNAIKQAVEANSSSITNTVLVAKIQEYLETQHTCLRCIDQMKTNNFLDYLN